YGTYMQNIPEIINDLINKNANKHIKIVMCSDGEVSDKKQVQDKCIKLSNALMVRDVNTKFRVDVLPIRCVLNSYSQPDTMALMAVGLFANNTNTITVDIAESNSDRFYSQMQPLVKDFIERDLNKSNRLMKLQFSN